MEYILLSIYMIIAIFALQYWFNRDFYKNRRLVRAKVAAVHQTCQNYEWIKEAKFFFTVKSTENNPILDLALHINGTVLYQGPIEKYSEISLDKVHRTEQLAKEYQIRQDHFNEFMKKVMEISSDPNFHDAYHKLLITNAEYELFPYHYKPEKN